MSNVERVRVGVVGCGRVAEHYLPELVRRPFIELVGLADLNPARARELAERFSVPAAHGDLDGLLGGPPFDLLVNLTSMPAHFTVNRAGLHAGRHVWSEKPLAATVAEGQALIDLARERGVRLWAAPTCVTSPQFAFMAQAIAEGRLGRVTAAHGCYGHAGELWSPGFFERGGGCLADLGVYNLTTLTGLLGPARAVVAMTGIVVPVRQVKGKPVTVEVEDNAMVLLDHGNACFSHVQTGFVYGNDHAPSGGEVTSVQVIGTEGTMSLCGYDWEPTGVLLSTRGQPTPERHCTDPGEYTWQYGAVYAARCLLNDEPGLITPEQALHVLEIMAACSESQATGQRVALTTTF